MAVYIAPNNRPVTYTIADKCNNQVVLSGTDDECLASKGIFFLEYLEATSGTTVTIKDGNDNTIVPGIASLNIAFSPLRCDYGIKITGDLVIAKGFMLREVLGA